MRRSQPLLGTFVEVCIADEASAPAQQKFFYQEICNVVYREISKVQSLMSRHDGCSDISKINRLSATGKRIVLPIHPWTYEVLLIAQKICIETNGLFDCGVGQFDPTHTTRKSHYDHASIRSIELLGSHEVSLHEPISLDLGGIAKGYAVDRGVDILKNFGIEEAVINAGGDLRVIGQQAHAINLRERVNEGAYIPLGELRDGAIASSSTRFGRTNMKGGKSYLINPKTRKYIEDDLSYSIVAPTCVVADSLTKVLAIEKNIYAPYFKKFGAIPIIVE
jgi:thiamine biosynthesis lipoprotein